MKNNKNGQNCHGQGLISWPLAQQPSAHPTKPFYLLCFNNTLFVYIYHFESVLDLVKSFSCFACILVFQKKFRCSFLPLQFTMQWIHKILSLWKSSMFTYESPDKLKIGLDPFEFTQLIFPNVTRSSLNFYSRVLYGCF